VVRASMFRMGERRWDYVSRLRGVIGLWVENDKRSQWRCNLLVWGGAMKYTYQGLGDIAFSTRG
jgi:hypothetical protein